MEQIETRTRRYDHAGASPATTLLMALIHSPNDWIYSNDQNTMVHE